MTQEYPATIEEALAVPGGAYFPEVNAANTITKQYLDEDENGRPIYKPVKLRMTLEEAIAQHAGDE